MDVIHDSERHRFFAQLPEGEGKLLYREPGPGVLDLLHTEVDPALRGKGIAAELARTAFEYARGAGLKVIPTCPYVQSWLKRHPDQGDIVIPPRGR